MITLTGQPLACASSGLFMTTNNSGRGLDLQPPRAAAGRQGHSAPVHLPQARQR
jgi:hypothetical protein